MRIVLGALTAAGFLGAATIAYAVEPTGTIKSIDISNHTVTLDNGSTYNLAKNVKLDNIKVGEKIRLTCDQASLLRACVIRD